MMVSAPISPFMSKVVCRYKGSTHQTNGIVLADYDKNVRGF